LCPDLVHLELRAPPVSINAELPTIPGVLGVLVRVDLASPEGVLLELEITVLTDPAITLDRVAELQEFLSLIGVHDSNLPLFGVLNDILTLLSTSVLAFFLGARHLAGAQGLEPR
jgi:hypothetical protein